LRACSRITVRQTWWSSTWSRSTGFRANECGFTHAGNPIGAAEAWSPQDSDQGASLSDLGLPEETVRAYAEGTSRGGILVAAQLEGSRVERIVTAYQEYGAADVHARETEWRSQAGRWSTCFLS
jgi:hypothetical protein